MKKVGDDDDDDDDDERVCVWVENCTKRYLI
jgi:hypothetical protein